MARLRPARALRRGATAVEFALILPLVVVMFVGVLEYGWYFFTHSMVMRSARMGCRAGAVVPTTGGMDPTAVAMSAMMDEMDDMSFSSVVCSAATPDPRCKGEVTLIGATPEMQISCAMDYDYGGITGLVPLPGRIQARSVLLLEFQP